MAPLNVLIIDDEKNIRHTLRVCIESLGGKVSEASSAETAAEAVGRATYDMAFLDLKLGTQNGLDVIPTLLAENAGAVSVVDAQGAALTGALKAKPGLVKPNQTELAATVGRELKSEADVMRAMRELCERGAQRVIVTAGREPALAFDGKIFRRIITPRIQVVNPIGSGDAFTASVVWRLLRGDDLGEACRWGAAAGAANALTPLPGELKRKDVNRLAKDVRVRKI